MPVDQMYALHWPPTIRRIKEAAVPPAGGLTHGSNGGGIHVLPRHALSSPGPEGIRQARRRRPAVGADDDAKATRLRARAERWGSGWKAAVSWPTTRWRRSQTQSGMPLVHPTSRRASRPLRTCHRGVGGGKTPPWTPGPSPAGRVRSRRDLRGERRVGGPFLSGWSAVTDPTQWAMSTKRLT